MSNVALLDFRKNKLLQYEEARYSARLNAYYLVYGIHSLQVKASKMDLKKTLMMMGILKETP
jgi:hypothetical protein